MFLRVITRSVNRTDCKKCTKLFKGGMISNDETKI